MDYRIEEVGPFAIVGVRNRVNNEQAFTIIPGLWKRAGDRGLFGQLWEVRKDGHKIRGILGVCSDGGWGQHEEFDYIMAVTSDQSPPDGMIQMALPAAVWAVFEVPGYGFQDIWKRLYTEWVPASAYELADVPAIECYLPVEENRNELWIPVVKKQSSNT